MLLTPGYTVFIEGAVDDESESFDFIEQPAQKRAKTSRGAVSGREVPGGRDTQQRDYGDLVDENATIPMETWSGVSEVVGIIDRKNVVLNI